MHNKYHEHLEDRKQHHFGYPYNLDFSYSKYAYLLDYLVNNLGDPFIPSNYALDSREFEKDIVKHLANLWRFKDAWGYVTSSGTEGNLAALLYGKVSLNNPVVYYSADTHYSIGKGCMAYSLDSVVLQSQAHGEMDYDDLARAVQMHQDRDHIVICNISTTFKGAYDSAHKILDVFQEARISRDRLFIHGDGALGGMILPFLSDVDDEYQINGELFDSISVSGHKMPGVPIPCGVVLTKQSAIEKMAQEIEYLNSKDTTLNGSRNGLAAVLLYHALTDISKEAWAQKVQECVQNACYLSDALNTHGIRASVNPHSNTVVFQRPDEETVLKFQLACVGDEAHAVIMPNHRREQIDWFVTQLVEAASASWVRR